MNQNPVSKNLIVALGILLLALIVYSLSSSKTSSPPGAMTATSTPESSATVTSPSSQKNSPPASSKQILTASVLGGTIPFSTDFTLRLNPGTSCSQLAYVLSFGDNTEQNVQIPDKYKCLNPYFAVVSHQYQRAGTFTPTLYTKQIGGVKGETLATLTITAKNPVITTGKTQWGTFTTSPTSGAAPLLVDFTLSASDGNEGPGISYTISFGNGESAAFPRLAAPALSYTFSNPGTYYVTVNRKTNCSAGVCSGPSTSLGSINVTVH